MIGSSRLSSGIKQLLLLPSWIPWMLIALGAPILAGSLSLAQAINLGGAMTMGMVVSVVFARNQRSKR